MRLICRAVVSEDCYREYEATEEELTDSTRRNDTVVCHVCYALVEPFMKMNQPSIPLAVDEAVETYRINFGYVERAGPESLPMLLSEATAARDKATPGSSLHRSSQACIDMVEQRLARRQG